MAASISLLPLIVIFLLHPLVYGIEINLDLQCFRHCVSSSAGNTVIYAANTTLYSAVLESSARNPRFHTPGARKPLAVVLPDSEAGVRDSVYCARRCGVQIRARSGGHDYEGLSYVAYSGEFIVLDIRKLSDVVVLVDGDRRTAWVQAGVTLGELYYKIAEKTAARFGFPAGLCPTVGVGGHFSGGGIGTMMRKHGLAADNILDARMVTSNGDIVDRETMGEDLFWAIRGGGAASFGVVLAFKIKLVRVPRKVTVFTKSAISRGADNSTHSSLRLVLKWQDMAYRADKRLFIRLMNVVIAPTETRNGTLQAYFQSLFLGDKAELLRVMAASFPELGMTAEDCQEMAWLDSVLYFAGYSAGEPREILLNRTTSATKFVYKAKSDFLTKPMNSNGWRRMWHHLKNVETSLGVVIVDPLGGRMGRVADAATPFPHRNGSLYNIQYMVLWLGADDGDEGSHLRWIRRLYEHMSPFVSKRPRAAYLNYRDLDLGRCRGAAPSYGAAEAWGRKYFKGNFRRLAMVKAAADPGNFFRNEQSIPPLFMHRRDAGRGARRR